MKGDKFLLVSIERRLYVTIVDDDFYFTKNRYLATNFKNVENATIWAKRIEDTYGVSVVIHLTCRADGSGGE